MTLENTAPPSTPCNVEFLIPEVRIGVLHDPHYKDMAYITNTILASRWFDKDPEFCFIKDALGQRHEVGKRLEELYQHVGYFVADREDTGWLKMWEEIVEYSTHLLVFIRRDDKRLKAYLTSDNCPKRPSKVIILD